MLFNSVDFVPFIICVLILYYFLPHRSQNTMLLIASYIFYGAWDYRFLSLIAFSTFVDYFVSLKLYTTHSISQRKLLLFTSCACNLGLLMFFKYFNFFFDSALTLLSVFGFKHNSFIFRIILPVGISFYTFQTMGYTIDVYYKKIDPVRNFFDFALYVSFFPQLVAGPIERAKNLLPQIMSKRCVTSDQIKQGLWLLLLGYFQKLVVADNMAPLVDPVFKTAASPNGFQCILGTYAFAVQIYCDFAGYSNIARGISKLLGIDLMVNFRQPYFAINPREFWHRWHISLSTWLRDYLYIPLGGNRRGSRKTYRNIMITMILGGLWHGANWTFVIWGFYHGLLLSINRFFQEKNIGKTATNRPQILSRVITFHLVCIGWLIFRADNMSQALNIMHQIFTAFSPNALILGQFFPLFLLGALIFCIDIWIRDQDDVRKTLAWQWGMGPLFCTCLFIATIFLAAGHTKQFIYFQF